MLQKSQILFLRLMIPVTLVGWVGFLASIIDLYPSEANPTVWSERNKAHIVIIDGTCRPEVAKYVTAIAKYGCYISYQTTLTKNQNTARPLAVGGYKP